MKISLDSENEWGYFIDNVSFQVVNISDEVPNGSFVVIKEREYLEDIDRTVIQTIYGVVQGNWPISGGLLLTSFFLLS